MWDKIIEKAVNVEAKDSRQSPFGTREIDSRCPRGYRPLVKKNKGDANREHQDKALNKDKDKAKTHNSSFANSQFQTQTSKKCHRSRQEGHSANKVNVTKVAKKNKAKDLSYIKCYTCKQKRHYANKCPEKQKN